MGLLEDVPTLLLVEFVWICGHQLDLLLIPHLVPVGVLQLPLGFLLTSLSEPKFPHAPGREKGGEEGRQQAQCPPCFPSDCELLISFHPPVNRWRT